MCWGVVGKEKTCHLSAEQRFKVISELVQTTSPGTCWLVADLGFWVLARKRASGIQHKTFPVSERKKMKKAEFLDVAAKGEADAEQRKEGTWEKEPVKAGRSPKLQRREGSPEPQGTLGRTALASALSQPGLRSSCQNGCWTGGPAASRPGNRPCRLEDHALES